MRMDAHLVSRTTQPWAAAVVVVVRLFALGESLSASGERRWHSSIYTRSEPAVLAFGFA